MQKEAYVDEGDVVADDLVSLSVTSYDVVMFDILCLIRKRGTMFERNIT